MLQMRNGGRAFFSRFIGYLLETGQHLGLFLELMDGTSALSSLPNSVKLWINLTVSLVVFETFIRDLETPRFWPHFSIPHARFIKWVIQKSLIWRSFIFFNWILMSSSSIWRDHSNTYVIFISKQPARASTCCQISFSEAFEAVIAQTLAADLTCLLVFISEVHK